MKRALQNLLNFSGPQIMTYQNDSAFFLNQNWMNVKAVRACESTEVADRLGILWLLLHIAKTQIQIIWSYFNTQLLFTSTVFFHGHPPGDLGERNGHLPDSGSTKGAAHLSYNPYTRSVLQVRKHTILKWICRLAFEGRDLQIRNPHWSTFDTGALAIGGHWSRDLKHS